ncbi:MAG: protein SCO1/2 [Bradymonadia bacterium]|jgi:protein SCO1/2
MRFLTSILVLLFAAAPLSAFAAEDLPRDLVGVDVDEHLGSSVPLDLLFTNTVGEQVRLADYVNGDVPVILTLNYFECPMLCGLQLNAFVDTLKQVAWLPGDEFRIVTVSINPDEGPSMSAPKREGYLDELDREGAEWVFLTGDEANINALADAVGFEFNFIDETGEYAHPALLTFLSPEGVVTRYLYGLAYEERDVRLALFEAADGQIGTTVHRLILSCYVYDPERGSYVQDAMMFMRLGGALFVLALAGFLAFWWRRERAPTPTPEMV